MVTSIPNYLFPQIITAFKTKIGCLALVGSFSTGNYSPQHPDINFVLIFNRPPTGRDYLRLGRIFSRTVHHFDRQFDIRFEYRPFKFPPPYGPKRNFEVFINPVIADISQLSGDYPLNMPKNILAGMKSSRKIIFGRDLLGTVPTTVNKKYVLKTASRDLGIFITQLKFAALSHDLTLPSPYLLNETISLGKMLLRLGLEITLSDHQLRSGTYLKHIHDLPSIHRLYQRHYGQKTADSARLILRARDQYDQWKHNSSRIFAVYQAAHHVGTSTWSKLSQLSQP